MLKHYVLQLILDRAEIVVGEVPPFRIVKIIDVVHNLGACQFGRQLGVIEGQFAFERAEEGLRNSIIPAVFSSAHAANDPTGIQRGLIIIAGVGTPLVRVVEETDVESTTLDCCIQCCECQLSVVVATQLIAHHPTREQIQDDREIELA